MWKQVLQTHLLALTVIRFSIFLGESTHPSPPQSFGESIPRVGVGPEGRLQQLLCAHMGVGVCVPKHMFSGVGNPPTAFPGASPQPL